MKDYLLSLTAYNTWANNKVLNFIDAAGEDRASMVQISSFTTIRQTILHLLDAQTIWLTRLNGDSLVDWPGKNFTDSTKNACVQLVGSSIELEEFAAKLSESDIIKMVKYQNLKGEPFQNSVGQIMVHVMNHGTFHRGQLITMLRGAGFTDLTSTDMIAYFRESAIE